MATQRPTQTASSALNEALAKAAAFNRQQIDAAAATWGATLPAPFGGLARRHLEALAAAHDKAVDWWHEGLEVWSANAPDPEVVTARIAAQFESAASQARAAWTPRPEVTEAWTAARRAVEALVGWSQRGLERVAETVARASTPAAYT